jgi:ubiquinone biosynthesis protein UbiJ
VKLAVYLEPLINRLLAMDVAAQQGLSKFDGKVIAIELLNTAAVLYITLVPAGITLSARPERTADLHISGTPAQFASYLLAMKRGEAVPVGGLQISGDAVLAQVFQTSLKNLDLDWEEELSRWIGDTLAHQAGRGAHKAAGLIRHAGTTLKQDLSEYLRYETNILPDKEMITEFNASVDVLRDDVERLKMRIRRLQQAAGRE